MAQPTVLVLLAEGFEELEALAPVDLLRRAGAEVTLCSLNAGIHVTGRNKVTVHADTSLEALPHAPFDCVLLPGGPGVQRLCTDPRSLEIVRNHHSEGRWIAAICAAPLVLKTVGILPGRSFTAHVSVIGELPDALLNEKVVVDGKLITSRGAGTALDFGLTIVEKLFSQPQAAEVARSICS